MQGTVVCRGLQYAGLLFTHVDSPIPETPVTSGARVL